MYIVYMHTTPSNKRYIGITCQKTTARWRNGNGYSNTKYFYNAIIKYGWDNIKHEIIAENLTFEEASLKEKEYIKLYRTQDKKYGYNICEGGQSGWAGLKHSEESKKKMSAAKRGKNYGRTGWHWPESVKQKLSNSHKGKYRGKPVEPKISGWKIVDGKRVFSEEHRRKISEALTGIERSQQVRENMSRAQVKTKRKVLCLDNGKVYESLTSAAKELGTSKTMVYRVCMGINQTANGHKFKYVEGQSND